MVKAGILGGGQLGRMLLQQAANYPVLTYVLENDPDCPAAHLCHYFELGDIRHYDDVYRFGKKLDLLTIEIESVNIEALEKLEEEGLAIFPATRVLRLLKNKIVQKEFYASENHPTADFEIVQNASEVHARNDFLPFVQKLAEGGYDGRGVSLMRTSADLVNAFDAPGIIEKLVDVEKEIAVIVAVDANGNQAIFPPVEMIFDQTLNLLDYQVCPARISEKILAKAEKVGSDLAKSFESPGLFAIELFLDKQGNILINETAPRVHNSGHHSIEGNSCSQYDMLWRVMLGYPLGDPGITSPSALVNVIGEKDHTGQAEYVGLSDVMAMKRSYVHLYGKKQTKPGRKMGHITLLGTDRTELIIKAKKVKDILKVITFSLVILAVCAACGNKQDKIQPNAGAQKKPVSTVEGFIVQASTVTNSIEVPGSLMAFESTELHPEVSGRVVQLNIREGSTVQKGTLLVKLFDGDLQAQLKKLQVQQSINETTVQRQGELLKISGISQQEYDLSALNVSNIKADIDVIRTSIQKTEIRAPFTGRLGLRSISEGAYVTPTTDIATIQQVQRLKLEFTVPEKYTTDILVGSPVTFGIEGNDTKYKAKIIAAESMVAETNRSLRVRAEVSKVEKTLTP
ncbi:MAG: 5-(carboxyamino)imidazole ribonucleotide synthase, partial [Chitinophagaceae bacterium]